jgi:hypothetical protein
MAAASSAIIAKMNEQGMNTGKYHDSVYGASGACYYGKKSMKHSCIIGNIFSHGQVMPRPNTPVQRGFLPCTKQN